MYIDIYDYFDRWMHNYIVYHTGHLEQYGDVERANIHFGSKANDAIENMRDAASENLLSGIQVDMRSKAAGAASSLNIADQLQNGSLLNETMDQIAEGLNQAIDLAGQQVTFENYEDYLAQAGKFNGMLAKGDPDAATVDQFFSLLIKALEQAKMINTDILQALSGISSSLGGADFALDNSYMNKIEVFDIIDAEAAQKVIDSLSRAAEKLKQEGVVNSRSFATTINYIFQKVIGQQIQQIMIAEGLNYIVDSADKEFEKMMKKSLHGKLTWVDKEKRSNSKSSNFDASLFDNGVLSLRVKKERRTVCNIEIGTDTSLKLYKNFNSNRQAIQIIGRASITDYFTDMQERYLAYNVIAHSMSVNTGKYNKETEYRNSGNLTNAYDKVRQSVAASFFTDWIKSGGFRNPAGRKAQFIMIQGKVYPVMRIISNICNDIVKNRYYRGIEMNIPDVRNKWIGDQPNKELALQRSAIVNELINKITIAATLNVDILKKYAY